MSEQERDDLERAIDPGKDSRIWAVERSRTILKDRWIDVRADDCVRSDGLKIAPYYVLHYPDWVHVVCQDVERRLCLVDQYRHGIGKVVREFPGGMLEPGETPLAGAQRELKEETGFSATEWRCLGAYSPNPATHSNLIHVFACTSSGVGGGVALDESEDINSYFATLAEIERYIADGSFMQLNHIGILQRAKMAGVLD